MHFKSFIDIVSSFIFFVAYTLFLLHNTRINAMTKLINMRRMAVLRNIAVD
jgi:hypothetical protein